MLCFRAFKLCWSILSVVMFTHYFLVNDSVVFLDIRICNILNDIMRKIRHVFKKDNDCEICK